MMMAPAPPHFVILGTQRGGTTSLYYSLITHPQVLPAARKEVQFFSLHHERGPAWYRAQFPAAVPDGAVTGEASPYYLFHPHAPRRLHAYAPQARLIVLLRNPIDRAYSHYQHEVRRQTETLPFAEALNQEATRLQGETERLLADEHYYSAAHQCFSYVARGRYVEQLQAWLAVFPRDQMLILESEDLYRDPTSTVRHVTSFLQLEPVPLGPFKVHNAGSYPPMTSTTRAWLTRAFAETNRRLHTELGLELTWIDSATKGARSWDQRRDAQVPESFVCKTMLKRSVMPVCIAGMHCSGTSMVTKLLHDCGLYLGSPDNLMPPSKASPEGYWENLAFFDINEDILNELGGSSDCPPPLPTDWGAQRFAPFRAQAKSLLGHFVEREPWGWKDPRNCLTLPFWQSVLGELRIVVVVRNPLEVALSLRKRNGFSIPLGLTLWQIYHERLLKAAAPDASIVTHYDAYFDKPESEVRRLLSFLHMPVPEDLKERCGFAGRSDLRHHRVTTQDLRNAHLSTAVIDLYARLCDASELCGEGTIQGVSVASNVNEGTGGVRKHRRQAGSTSAIAPGENPTVAGDSSVGGAGVLEAGVGRVNRYVLKAEVLRKDLEKSQASLAERERAIQALTAELRQAGESRVELERSVALLTSAKDAAEREVTELRQEQSERAERERILGDLAREKEELQRANAELKLQRMAEEQVELERRLATTLAAKEAAERRASEMETAHAQLVAAVENEAAEQRARALLPPAMVTYVVGGAGADQDQNSTWRNFPLLDRKPGEKKAAHLARVVWFVGQAMAAGGTHLFVPSEHADWLRDYPLVADYFATYHGLAEASTETGIVFTLHSLDPVDFTV